MNYDEAVYLQEIDRDEGNVLHLYKDSLGNWTIGRGTNLSAGIDENESRMLFEYRRNKSDAALVAALPWVNSLDPVRQRVISQMAYNMGVEGLLTFTTTLGYMQAGLYDHAAGGFRASAADHEEPARMERWAELIEKGA